MITARLVARICGFALCLCPLAPALAQDQSPTGHQADVVVNGEIGKRSDWKRAETDHAIVYSQGSADELKRVARNLELLHSLMSRLYRQGDTSDDAAKVTVTLVGSQAGLHAMKLGNARFQAGPFSPGFDDGVYYDPRETGDVLAVARADQSIDLNTRHRAKKDCDDYMNAQQDDGGESEGAGGLCATNLATYPPVVRPWEAALYSGFAQHFLLTYAPAPYPRWYLDGIGALFSTLVVKRDGAIDYACPPDFYKQVLRSYGDPDVAAILSGRYLDAPQTDAGWSPYGAWLLTHYFVFANLKPERHAQFQKYMAAIRQGTPMAEAAAVFGDMKKLQREVVSYADSDIAEAHGKPPTAPVPDPLITTLTPVEGSLVDARLQLDSRLAQPTAGMDWLAQIGASATQLPDDPDALSYLAEAECRSGASADCLAIADRLLAKSPGNADAMVWKGVALTDRAVAGSVADRPARLTEARATLQRAIALDSNTPMPLIAYFQSFTKAGDPAPVDAVRGMVTVIRDVPAAPGPRFALSQELARQGQPDLARRLVAPVLYGAYDSPEKKAATALFVSAH